MLSKTSCSTSARAQSDDGGLGESSDEGRDQQPRKLRRKNEKAVMAQPLMKLTHTDGEVVIMLAFQASGTGSIPVRCTLSFALFIFFLRSPPRLVAVDNN
jgi:hypothetical protein